MQSGTTLKMLVNRALYYSALLIFANGLGSFNLGQSANCWAGQTVPVNPGDNLQALVNQYPQGTTFSLAPGVYRLQSVQPKSYDAFVGQTGAILSGAGLLTSFSQNGAYWVSHVQVVQAAAYPGECTSTHPACTLPEDLFFDNVPKSRVLSLSAVGPGSWFLDYTTGTVYMGDNPAGHTVEISLSSWAFNGGAASVNISNLTIEKYACPAQTGAVNGSWGSSYWAVTGNEIRYNHGRGITTGDGMYISNNQLHDNGQLGLGGSGNNICVQNNQIYNNNYAGYSYYWEAGGVKFSGVRNVTVQYNYSHNNAGPGFWNDINSQSVTYNQNQASGNLVAGIMSEISSNITISGNYIWDDGYNPDGSGIWWGGGIVVSNSSNVSVYFNSLANCMNGIVGILASRGNAPNGQPYLLQNVNANSNTIYQGSGVAAGIAVEGTGFDNSVYTTWNNTLRNNTYYLSTPGGSYFYWMGAPMTLNAFASLATSE